MAQREDLRRGHREQLSSRELRLHPIHDRLAKTIDSAPAADSFPEKAKPMSSTLLEAATASPLTELPTLEELAGSIDHAILAPTTTDQLFSETVALAAELNLFSICVPSSRVLKATRQIESLDSSLKVGTVVAFPHGNASDRAIRVEIDRAIYHGAVEVDAVIDIGLVLSGRTTEAVDLVAGLATFAKHNGIQKFKVIFENAYLFPEQIIELSEAFSQVDTVDFIKTSTGYAPHGALIEDVELMVKHGGSKEVKASGGIRTLDQYLEFRQAGVTRFGTSNSAVLLRDLASRIETGSATGELGGAY